MTALCSRTCNAYQYVQIRTIEYVSVAYQYASAVGAVTPITKILDTDINYWYYISNTILILC